MVKKTLLLFFLSTFLLLPALAQKQRKEAPLFIKYNHLEGTDTLRYRFLKPEMPDEQTRYPLIIFLHGAGERGNNNESNINHIADVFDRNKINKYPCFVIAPQCPRKKSWSDFMGQQTLSLTATPTRPMQLFLQLLDKVIKENPIDPSRIYLIGLSMGGYGTWELMARYPQKFAAAVPICGGGDLKTVQKIKHIPVWAFHGAKDGTVPPERSRVMVAALQSAGALPGYTEYPDIEHNSWVQAFKEPHLWPWLFKQKLPPPAPAGQK